ncbi:hypothetical protein [Modestobacter sp. VKM Ac-2985]|uniref:hypothetical protein n=1 Tax=Modestobacter sp. VKM Ac-2985 TaxID=3004139 RepID=UPI0022ABC1E3|nr:hypothetical protein [Modestobacter sp. VKM Ac-2985]MCZ2837129.1 hypothetical protein [Modestobacter sp. VKM Ac-2985]
MGTETVALFTQFGPGVAVMVLLIVLLVKLRDRVGSRVDESVEDWINRLEKKLDAVEKELRDERESGRRYRRAREMCDAEHRRWDSLVLHTALAGGDVAKLPDPPALTPHPSTYELDEPKP